MTQNKTTKKVRSRTTYNQTILKALADRYDYSINYIVKSLRGDRVGIMPDVLMKEYKEMDDAANEAIKKKASQLTKN